MRITLSLSLSYLQSQNTLVSEGTIKLQTLRLLITFYVPFIILNHPNDLSIRLMAHIDLFLFLIYLFTMLEIK
jgi:hypothetical protein